MEGYPISLTYHLLPKNQHPLNDKQFWNSEDDALTSVVSDIYNAINDFSKKETTGGNRNRRQPTLGKNQYLKLIGEKLFMEGFLEASGCVAAGWADHRNSSLYYFLHAGIK